jgi:CheY-like chemotaxis protein
VVARDPNLVRVLTAALAQSGIEPKICAAIEDALARLHAVKFDSVMVDCVEFEDGFEVLRGVRQTQPNRKAIVFAILDEEASAQERSATGANFVLERPLQPDMLVRSLRAARNLMVSEHRRYFRHRIEMRVSLIRGNNEVRVEATNLSTGGMAVRLEKPLEMGWIGQVEFVVPETKLAVQARAEVVWVAEMQAGVRFMHVPLRVFKPFEEWLAQKADEDGLDVVTRVLPSAR